MAGCFSGCRFRWELGACTYVMGILNVTPDSFSDGGKWLRPEAAVEHALQMEKDGAHMLDIGGQSTRPGHTPVSAGEEWERLEPVIRELRGKIQIPISVDTYYPDVAEKSLHLGVSVINDVSGRVNPLMVDLAKAHWAGYIIMHAGSAGENPAACLHTWLKQAAQEAEDLGLPPEQICLDPGIGFGKGVGQNLRIIRDTAKIKVPPYAYLVGASRKRTIGDVTGRPPKERDFGTVAAHTAAVLGGADIVRVHEVKGAVDAARVADRILRGE